MPRESFYDEVEIEDFKWDPQANVYHYPCPCGDRFEISKSQLRDGDEVARCPSCSLIVRVVYEWDDYEDYDSGEEQEAEEEEEVSNEGDNDEDNKPSPEAPIIATPSTFSIQSAAAVAIQVNAVPTALLAKLDIDSQSDEDEKQGRKGIVGDGESAKGSARSPDGNSGVEKNETEKLEAGEVIGSGDTVPRNASGNMGTNAKPRTVSPTGAGGRRSSTPPPRSPKRVEVELE